MEKITYEKADVHCAMRVECPKCGFFYHMSGYPGLPRDQFNGWMEWCSHCMMRVMDVCTQQQGKNHVCVKCGAELVNFKTWLASKQPLSRL